MFASFLSLRALVMIVLFVLLLSWLWFRGCLFRPVRVFYGLCRGPFPLAFASLVFRNTGSGASCEEPLPAVGFYASANRDRAPHSSPPCSPSFAPFSHHLGEGGGASEAAAPISGLENLTQAETAPEAWANPTRIRSEMTRARVRWIDFLGGLIDIADISPI